MLFTVRLILAECRYPLKAIRVNLKARGAGTSISREIHNPLARTMKDEGCKNPRAVFSRYHRRLSRDSVSVFFFFFFFRFPHRDRGLWRIGGLDPSIVEAHGGAFQTFSLINVETLLVRHVDPHNRSDRFLACAAQGAAEIGYFGCIDV